MKRAFLLLFSILTFCLHLEAQKKELTYYLPDIEYDANIPTPEEFLGYQIGEWHISHDQLTYYLKELARLSPRVTIEEYARSYEARPLSLLTITSVENQKNIDQILADHQAISDPNRSKKINLNDQPTVLYQGYTIHGNEASGANAAPLVAYYLAAGKGAAIDELLDNVVILLDPCYNPDGMDRFASWVNRHKNANLISDPNDREYSEVWPGGRTNHYWFDLNRDWLLVQHPESQGRIRNFHKWKPNILTDHHEMGTNSTYFFQPGVPSRTNPITPPKNQELTGKIAEFHAAALDKIGSLYYTRESFDDFYYGKGSTYPDANGCIGILFEQASSRGHLQESDNGILSFPFTVRNQVTSSLSTQEAALNLRKELLTYQRDFYTSAMNEARSASTQGYVFGDNYDASRVNALLDMLLQHQIEVYAIDNATRIQGQNITKGNAFFVPTNQIQNRLVRGIFETMTSFQDSLFYDISTWVMPYAFNIPFEAVSGTSISKGNQITTLPKVEAQIIGKKTNYAYAFEWDDYFAPKALFHLQKEGLLTKVVTRTFSSQTAEGRKDFNYGTILISVQNQQNHTEDEVYAILQEAIKNTGVKVYAISTGLTPNGVDLGSPNIETLKQPKVLLVVGNRVSSYDSGEVWHLLDQRYGMPITIVEQDEVSYIDLGRYTDMVLVDGGYTDLNVEKVKNWVQNGGSLITFKRATRWASTNGLAGVNMRSSKGSSSKKTRPYIKAGEDYGASVIGGAIFETELDLTHPICYGYHTEKMPSFRRGTLFFERPSNRYAMPSAYTISPLLSGYISNANYRTLKNSATIIVTGIGRGRTISFSDNTNFRAFWWGTNKLFANALFFGDIISRNTTESPRGTTPKKQEEAVDSHGHQH